MTLPWENRLGYAHFAQLFADSLHIQIRPQLHGGISETATILFGARPQVDTGRTAGKVAVLAG